MMLRSYVNLSAVLQGREGRREAQGQLRSLINMPDPGRLHSVYKSKSEIAQPEKKLKPSFKLAPFQY